MKKALLTSIFTLYLIGALSADELFPLKEHSHPNIPAKKDAQPQQAAWVIEAARAANDYVETIDKELYAKSWNKGDQIFQHTISQNEWANALTQNRKPLGKVISRKLKDERLAMDPQGLPKGAYMVVEYQTSFERAPHSGEVLTLRHDDNGDWKVLTYQVN